MRYLLPLFKLTSGIFAIAAVGTGFQAVLDPVGFSKSFGLPLSAPSTSPGNDGSKPGGTIAQRNSLSYVSLMGIRQLATGIILATFAWQEKWTEVASILAIIGVVVAGTDAYCLSRAGNTAAGRFHAIPGFAIAALAGSVMWLGDLRQ